MPSGSGKATETTILGYIGRKIEYRFEKTWTDGSFSTAWEQGTVRSALTRWPGWYAITFDDGQQLDVLLAKSGQGDVWRWVPSNAPSVPDVRAQVPQASSAPDVRTQPAERTTRAATGGRLGALLVRSSDTVRWTKYVSFTAVWACLQQLRSYSEAVARQKVTESCASGGTVMFAGHYFQRAEGVAGASISTVLPASAAAARHALCKSCHAVHSTQFATGEFCSQACAFAHTSSATRSKPAAGSRSNDAKATKKTASFVCEKCSVKHDGSFGAGRFCSKSCAASSQKRLRLTCEGCGELHDGSYGSGRFCGKPCAAKNAAQRATSSQSAPQAVKATAQSTSAAGSRSNDAKATKKTASFVCEKCSVKHDGSFGAGRFCSKSCAASSQKRLRLTCEGCGGLHDGSYGSGRFCGKPCAAKNAAQRATSSQSAPQAVKATAQSTSAAGSRSNDAKATKKTASFVCEKCSVKHDGSFGAGRFCSKSCAASSQKRLRLTCEGCGELHDGSYGSGRFCGKPCAAKNAAQRATPQAVKATAQSTSAAVSRSNDAKATKKTASFVCEKCSVKHDGSFGAGRFCSKSCAASSQKRLRLTCEGCGELHDGSYGSGRFCGKPCAGKQSKQRVLRLTCEGCGGLHDGSYGSGRFCGKPCAAKNAAQRATSSQSAPQAVKATAQSTSAAGSRSNDAKATKKTASFVCEKCSVKHDGSFGAGRFCSKSCAASSQKRLRLTCEGCGELHDGSYGSGRFCGKPCAGKQSKQRVLRLTCEGCGGLHDGSYGSGRFCGKPCAGKQSKQRVLRLTCEGCGGLHDGSYGSGRFCGKPCAAKNAAQRATSSQSAPQAVNTSTRAQSVPVAASNTNDAKVTFDHFKQEPLQTQRHLEGEGEQEQEQEHDNSDNGRCQLHRDKRSKQSNGKQLDREGDDRQMAKLEIEKDALQSSEKVDHDSGRANKIPSTGKCALTQPASSAAVRKSLRKPGGYSLVKEEQKHEPRLGPHKDQRSSPTQRPLRERRAPKKFEVQATETRDLRAHRTIPKASPQHRAERDVQDGGKEAVQGTRVRARKHSNRPLTVHSRKVSKHEHAIPTAAVPAATRSTRRVQLNEVLEETIDGEIPPATRLEGLQEAPVFHPTEEEFLDPMAYIESIRPTAERFGICNIVPPSSWKSKLRLDPALKFQASKQKLHMAPLPGQPLGFRKSKRLFTKESFASHARVLARELYGERMVELGEAAAEHPCTLESQFWQLAEKHSAREQAHHQPKKSGQTSGHTRAQKTPESLYGSDVISTGHDNGTDWNLCRLAGLSDNILHYVSYPIHGVNTPMLYFGMLFSRFCWHVEDDDLNSISYLHEGAPKSWWGIPASAADGFEKIFQDQYAELIKAYPSLRYAKGVMLNPEKLLRAGVPVSHVIHRPGTFVVTFPHAYHCGFNHGINVAEAVNFAGLDWLKHGMRSMNLYREIPVVKSSVLAFEKLLCDLARHSKELSPQLADETYAHLEIIAKEYDSFLADVQHKREMSLELPDIPPDSNSLGVMCSVCNHHCYILGVHCQQAVTARPKREADERWSCSRHFGLLKDQGFTELTCCVFAPLGMVKGLMGQIRQTKELRSQSCNDQPSLALPCRGASANENSGQPYQNLSTVTVGSRVAVTDDPAVTGRIDSINHGYAQLTLDTGRRRAFRLGNLMRIGGDAAVSNQPMAATNVRWTVCCTPGCERWHELPIGHPIPPAGQFVCAMNTWNPEKTGCPSMDPGSGDSGASKSVDRQQAIGTRLSSSETCDDVRPAKRPRSISNDQAATRSISNDQAATRSISNEQAATGTCKVLLAKSLSGGNQHSLAKSLSGGDQHSRAGHDRSKPVETARVDAEAASSVDGKHAPGLSSSTLSFETTEHPKPPSARSTDANKTEDVRPQTQSEQSGRNLTQAQYKLAAKLLNPHFDHRKGAQQFRGRKAELVGMINDEFRKLGLPGQYTTYKLDLWVSNSMQRARQQAMTEMHKRDERSARSVMDQQAQSLRNEPVAGQVMQHQQTQLHMPSQFPWVQGHAAPRTAWMPMVSGLSGSNQHPQVLLSAQQQPTVGSSTVNATHAEHLAAGFGTGTAIHATADLAREQTPQVTSIRAPIQVNANTVGATAAADLMQHNSSMASMQARNVVGSDERPALAAGLIPMDGHTMAETGLLGHPATHAQLASGARHQVQLGSHLLEQQRDMEQQQMLLRMRAELQLQQRDQTGDARMTRPAVAVDGIEPTWQLERRTWW